MNIFEFLPDGIKYERLLKEMRLDVDGIGIGSFTFLFTSIASSQTQKKHITLNLIFLSRKFRAVSTVSYRVIWEIELADTVALPRANYD